MKTVTLRMEDSVKAELDQMLAAMGMNIATFYNLYTLRAIREQRIPFEITSGVEPFYLESNMNQLRKSQKQVLAGKVITKTLKELEAMENE